jgi:hypothetical protein
MPFREKSAWINLVSLTVALVFFVASFRSAMMFLAAVLAYVGLQVVLHFASSRLSPKEARTPLDERELTIRLKSSRNAYWWLMLGVTMVPFSLHFGSHDDGGAWFRVHSMAYIAVVAVILAEMVRAISQIVYFRLGR